MGLQFQGNYYAIYSVCLDQPFISAAIQAI